MIEIDDLDGNVLKEVITFNEENISIVKIEETDSVLKLYIQDLTITEGETNGYIYTYKNGTLDKEDAFIE